VENDGPKARELLDKAWRSGQHAYRIGITGPPGAGKSTLVNGLAEKLSDEGKKIAIVSVDPSSPFTGGAVLGDRIRMNALSGKDNVYIRSMATRGSLGGLSMKTHDVCDILDGYGFDIILIETVGVGQIELDIARAADVTLTVLVPESGDDIQAMKAGIMEITNIFVVNKADRHGAEAMILNLQSLTRLRGSKSTNNWEQPVLKAIANKGLGVEEIVSVLNNYLYKLKTEKQWIELRLNRMNEKVKQLISDDLNLKFWNKDRKAYLKEEIYTKQGLNSSPFTIVEKLLKSIETLDNSHI
jgi:LAO/AO transport system kinase